MNSSITPTCSDGQLLCGFDYLYCLDVDHFDCSLLETCGCPPLEADSDIAGIGVLVAFVVSAFLTWLSTLVQLVLERRGKQHRFNIIDEYWTKYICLPIRNRVKHPDVWADCCFRLTYALSDQQLVTGIAMMIAGLRLLADETISVYHFSIVLDLAFFSSNAHLLSLLALYTAFSSDRMKHKSKRGKRHLPITSMTMWRFFCIFAFFGLLLVGTWGMAYRQWDNMYDCPAACVPRGTSELGGQPLAWAIATTYLLVLGYAQWALQLGEKIMDRDKKIRRWANTQSTTASQALERRLKSWPTLLKVSRGMKALALAWRYFAFSSAVEVISMFGWFIANCYWTVKDKMAGHRLMSHAEWKTENEMGFGQIVPLVLLMLPAMTFWEAYNDNIESLRASEKEIALSHMPTA